MRLEVEKLSARSPIAIDNALDRVRFQQEPYTQTEIELIASSPDVSAIVRKVLVTTSVDVLRWVQGSPSSCFDEAMDRLEEWQRPRH